jgi:Mg-chelatase subunit ChlD
MNRRGLWAWVKVLMLAVALVGLCSAASFGEPKTYAGVTFPHGDLAFADRVVEYVAASCVRNAYDDPEEALGPPDASTSGCSGCYGCDGCDTNAVALGFRLSMIDDRGYLVVEFVDNVLLDVSGNDLFIYITNGKPAFVEISTNGVTWIPVGQTSGCPAAIDIAPYVTGDDEYRFVRLTDVPADEDHSDCPGASIDAIGAMGEGEETIYFGEASGSINIRPTGQLLLDFRQGSADTLLILLDTTGSMADMVGGRQKIEIAKSAVIGLLDRLPAGSTVGLRTFSKCETNRLISPLDDPLSISEIKTEIEALFPAGLTPLAYTLEQAKIDVESVSGAKTLVLVSDGMETCQGSPTRAAADLAATRYSLTSYVIGFDVGGNLAARDQLIEIAQILGGTYLDAEDADQLSLALSIAAPLAYDVINEDGDVVYSGRLGDTGPGALAAGTYTVVIDSNPPIVIDDVDITGDGTTRIVIGTVNGALTAEVIEQ